MKKRRCQINAIYPITCFSVPIVGHTELNLTNDEIYKCLCAKAEVTEILDNGSMISLDFTNYDKPVIIESVEKINTVNEKQENNITNIILEEENSTEVQEIDSVDNINKDVSESEEITHIEDEVLEEDTDTIKEEDDEKINKEEKQSNVKTYEVSSRNNNRNQNYNKNKNKRKNKR